MYLKKLRLQNIKCFEDVTLEFPHRDGDYSGWNVILGTNGRGKTTLLRAAAVGTLNPWLGYVGLEQAGGQLRRDENGGPCRVSVDIHVDAREAAAAKVERRELSRSLRFANPDGAEVSTTSTWGNDDSAVLHALMVYGYGPFRRLDSTTALPTTFQFPQPLSRFTTLFTGEFGLPDAVDALTQWYVASVDPAHSIHRTAAALLQSLIAVVDALLPPPIRIAGVTSEGVRFSSASRSYLKPQDLSDGYRAFLAVVLDLLRHFAIHLGSKLATAIKQTQDGVVVDVPALVLIDEADAHLHPSWQRELGERLRRVFPKIQFIVTTHSPFIAQEASDNGLFVLTEQRDGTVRVEKPVRSVRGWTADQILTSPLFGLESTRAPEADEIIRAAADLTAREQQKRLTPAEKKRLKTFREWLAERLSAPGETYDEMRRQQEMARFVDETLSKLNGGHP